MMSRKKGAVRFVRVGGPSMARALVPVRGSTPLALAASALTLIGCAATTEPAAPDDAPTACPRERYIQPAGAPPILGGLPGPATSTATAKIDVPPEVCAQIRLQPTGHPMRQLIEPHCPPPGATSTSPSSAPDAPSAPAVVEPTPPR